MIHVLIERHIAEGMLPNYEVESKTALHRTYLVHGFISAESFANTKDIHHRFVLSKWRTQQDWNRWFQSAERMELMNNIAPILQTEELITILEN